MKKYIFLTLVLLASSLRLSAATINELYLVGSATSVGWDMNGLAMSKVDGQDGVFRWSGRLNTGQFKFLLVKNQHYNNLAATVEDQSVDDESKEYTVVHEPDYTQGQGNDYKFYVSAGDLYTVTVDTNTMKMTVKKSSTALSSVWIVGTAIPNGKAKLEKNARHPAGQFRYLGELKKGSFKILTTEEVGNETEYYVPTAEDTDAYSSGASKKTTDAEADGWQVIVADKYYKLIFDLYESKYEGTRCIDHGPIYIVGGATEAGWEAGKAIPLTQDPNNHSLFTFVGLLRVNPEGVETDMFKFILQSNWTPKSYHPQRENEKIMESTLYTNDIGSDYKWKINTNEQGYYRIVLNILEETIKTEFFGKDEPDFTNIAKVEEQPIILRAENGTIHIKLTDVTSYSTGSLYGINGQLLEIVPIDSASFRLGQDLNKGVYIVVLQQEGTSISRKVIVQ